MPGMVPTGHSQGDVSSHRSIIWLFGCFERAAQLDSWDPAAPMKMPSGTGGGGVVNPVPGGSGL